jgi:hypothetical protein
MKRINEGMYVEEVEVSVNGNPQTAEFRVFRVKAPDPKNPQKVVETLLWAYDCPSLNVLANHVFESKAEAMESMYEACKIGFRTVPIKATMLAIGPSSKR